MYGIIKLTVITAQAVILLSERLPPRRNDGQLEIPAFAGMTAFAGMDGLRRDGRGQVLSWIRLILMCAVNDDYIAAIANRITVSMR
jgi:hypothetical protein